MRARLLILASMALVFLGGAIASAAETGEAPAGYKMDHYRSSVPDELEGVTVVDDDAAFALWKTGKVVFIDVLPKPPKPKLPEGTIFRERPRFSIPNAIWLPNVGYGRLAEETDQYFRDHLDAATDGKDSPVLFFCLRDCWMSWNSAKRAQSEYGYTHVFWYPDGTDGWQFFDYPVEKSKPAEPLDP